MAFGVLAWFELAGMLISIIVALYLKRKNRTLNSPIIETEMQGWKIRQCDFHGNHPGPFSFLYWFRLSGSRN